MTSKLTSNLYADSEDANFVEEEAYDDFDDEWDEDFEEDDWDDDYDFDDDEDFDSIPAKRFSGKHECYEDD